EIAAPLVALAILLPLASALAPASAPAARGHAPAASRGPARPLAVLAGAAFALAAGACSLLAFANAPVGPGSYSPALTGLRDDVGAGPAVVLAPPTLLAGEHGTPYIAWELRGGRVCIAAAGELDSPPRGVRYVVNEGPP